MEANIIRFARDPNVIAYVLRQANGMCEMCGGPAPITDLNGAPFLEVHHVRPLAEGGPDTVDKDMINNYRFALTALA